MPAHKPFYVYTLTDPRDDGVFYIGKGQRDRLHHHTKEAKRIDAIHNQGKLSRIRDILDDGLEPRPTKVAEFTSEQEALDYERHLIAITPGLTNIMAGGGGALTPQAREAMLRARKARLWAFKSAKNKLWLESWLSVVASWKHGVTFPDMPDGDRIAEECVAIVKRLVKRPTSFVTASKVGTSRLNG